MNTTTTTEKKYSTRLWVLICATFALIPVAGLDLRKVSGVGKATGAASAVVESEASVASKPMTEQAYGQIEMSFEPDQGQTGSAAHYFSRGSGYSLSLRSTEALLQVRGSECAARNRDANPLNESVRSGPSCAELSEGRLPKPRVLRMTLQGANETAVGEGLSELEGKVNYFIGSDPSAWRTSIPTFGRVRYSQVYPGIDIEYYGNQRQLEYDFMVAPGADPRQVSLQFAGAESVKIDNVTGDLLFVLGDRTVRQQKPVAFQDIAGTRVAVESSYAMKGKGRVGFTLGTYDHTRTLTIDPLVLTYATFLGGSSDSDIGEDIAVDAAGSAYVTGRTESSSFPTTPGALDTTLNGSEVFVAKLNPAGSALVYSTFIGGTLLDGGSGIAVDAAGNAYITGYTNSSNFPTTPGAFDTSFNGGGLFDAFVAKLNPTGSALIYSTYLGGSNGTSDVGLKIAIDTAGDSYVTGYTFASDFPTTLGAFDTTYNGGSWDAFLTKVDPTGSTLVYSTFLGGSGNDTGYDIAVDATLNAYVVGETTTGLGFPTTPGAFNTSSQGTDAFVTKFNATGSSLVYSTFLGGGSFDTGRGIVVDAAGSAYVVGYTSSPTFPTTPGAFDTTFDGTLDAFVTKLDPSGSALVFSTALGGTSGEEGLAIAIDGAGNACVAGRTFSTNFPTTADAFDTTQNGAPDAYVTKFNGDGSSLVYSTFLGGSSDDSIRGIALDPSGSAYVVGLTSSSNFPTTAGALDTTYNGGNNDVFVTKFTNTTAASPTPTPMLSVNNVTADEGNSGTTTFKFTVALSQPSASTVTVDFATADGTATAASGDYVPTSGTLTFALGETFKTISVSVNGDTTVEPDENFFVDLTNPTGAAIAAGQGTGTATISNDDGPCTLVVTTPADSGAGSLRGAISCANRTPGADTITFQAGVTGVINLLTNLPSVTDAVTITGPGPDVITINCSTITSIGARVGLQVISTTANISGLTISRANTGVSTVSANVGLDNLVISGNGSGVRVSGGTIDVSNSTITNNTSSENGGGLAVTASASVTVTGSTISNNTTIRNSLGGGGAGGGISLPFTGGSTLTVSQSTISGNQAEVGGGIVSGGGNVTITDVTLTANKAIARATGGSSATALGGGIYNTSAGTLTLMKVALIDNIAEAITGKSSASSACTGSTSVITGNGSATAQGANVYNNGGVITATNMTVSGGCVDAEANSGSGSPGAAIANGSVAQKGGTAALTNVTLERAQIFGNGASSTSSIGGSGISSAGGTMTVRNTIFTNAPDCIGVITSAGHNLETTTTSATCGFNAGLGDLIQNNLDTFLGPLALNAPGTTKTRALLPGSAAIDAGDNSLAPATDQRGVARPQPAGGIVDIGAYELQGVTPTPTPGANLRGDVAPRPNGDGAVQSNDVVQVQRFQIGLDSIVAGSDEFKRADSAPIGTHGDGFIQSDDVVQTQRYQIGLDGMQSFSAGPESGPAVGGDVSSLAAAGDGTDVAILRWLKVQDVVENKRSRFVVNLSADAVGDEAAYGFTLNYDPTKLSSPVIDIGTAGGRAICNTATVGEIRCFVSGFADDQSGSSTDQIGEIHAGVDQLLLRVTFIRADSGATAVTLASLDASSDAAINLGIVSETVVIR